MPTNPSKAKLAMFLIRKIFYFAYGTSVHVMRAIINTREEKQQKKL